ncbi:hypothetical protein [Streptomyces chryseus]|uniref:hypothetical protein n=1 Tax=Streptomyces chryseus TaxID=68186 RepID=UPI00167A64AD|nr:hypothetical protein [Streptomyces chryseus]GGX42220.1 hypothetical protein GCM10010353_66730 [Streptomyces chryseus]
MSGTVLEPGTQVRFAKRTWTVVMLEGACVRLVDADNSVATVLANFLFADPDFDVVGAPQRGVPPFGLLEDLPEQVRMRAYAWERHVREAETGCPVPGQVQPPRAEFDPARRSMAEREAAKAAELTAAGQPASAVTVRRMRARACGGWWTAGLPGGARRWGARTSGWSPRSSRRSRRRRSGRPGR